MALTRDQVLQLRGDLSQFLIHLTRTGPVTIRKDIFPQLNSDQIVNHTAKQRLERLIKAKQIKAISSFGYFHYKVPKTYPNGYTHNAQSCVVRQWLKAVCFTETPLDHIHIQTQPILGRNLHFESYGLAFKEDFIRRQRGTPVMYFESTNQSIKAALDDMAISQDAQKFKSMMPLYESFGKRIYGSGPDVDFRWEREWRSIDDVSFEWSDVAFGLCKNADNTFFSQMVSNAFPFVEPPTNSHQLQQVKTYLRSFSHLATLK